MAGDKKKHFTLVWTDTFVRTARKFLRRHPELAGIFRDVLSLLEIDPTTPRLHIHPLQGKHQGKHAIKLTYDYRIVFILKIVGRNVILLDVGSHDEVYHI